MILGIGVDLIRSPRMERALTRWGMRLQRRLFTVAEWTACDGRSRPAECLAGTFAAKEALLKAMGTGLSNGMAWRQMEVVRGPAGEPSMRVSGRVRERLQEMGMKRIWVSISHEGDYAFAFAVIEG
jgi:holo-[acyl-carrier protein] synthase